MPRITTALRSWTGTLVATHPDPDAILALRPEGTVVKPFIPVATALEVADLMIGNGGTATVLAALTAGKPYLALYTNLDQALSNEQYATTGAVSGGLSLSMSPAKIRKRIDQALNSADMVASAQKCRDEFGALGEDEWTVRQLKHIYASLS